MQNGTTIFQRKHQPVQDEVPDHKRLKYILRKIPEGNPKCDKKSRE
jgi:hypothetical protein